MSKHQKQGIVDIGGGAPALSWYWFLGQGGAATVSGFYVDINGNQVGNSFSLSVSVADGSNNPVQLTSIPTEAVGALIRITTNAVYYSIWNGESFLPDFETNYANYPQMAVTGNSGIGRFAAPGV